MGGWRFLPRNGKALLCLGGAQEEGWVRVLVWMGMGREGFHTCEDLRQRVAWHLAPSRSSQ